MVIRIVILLLLTSNCHAQWHFNKLIVNGVTAKSVTGIKNIQPVSTDSSYNAFGILDSSRTNRLTYYFRRGTTHIANGNPYYREYNIAANSWYGPVQISNYADSLDSRDVSGGRMDNDSTVIFYARNHTDIYHSRDIYIQKCDSNNNFSAPVLFNWTGITHLQTGFFYGHIIKGNSPGEYYNILYQSNSDTGSTRYLLLMIKTTDYWNTYSTVGTIYDGTNTYSESSGVNLGGGNFIVTTRDNNSGALTPFESTNNGATWIRRNISNLLWYSLISEIPYMYSHDGVFDIIYECRDALMIHISKANVLSGTNFGVSFPVYNNQEVYAYNVGTSGASIGYPAIRKLPNGKYLIIYCKEYNVNRANLQWTVDDLITDPGSTPAAPSMSTSLITSTSFRWDITGLSETQIANIRYWQQDLSTDPAFGSFVTATYNREGKSTSIHDFRAVGLYNVLSALTTGTTYYLRTRACNNVGCSAYTTVNITTL